MAQTKYYANALTLSSTKPTMSGRTFKGWATSKTATAAGYQPGGKFTENKDVTLYGDLDDPNSEISQLIASKNAYVLLPEKGTKPQVHYFN